MVQCIVLQMPFQESDIFKGIEVEIIYGAATFNFIRFAHKLYRLIVDNTCVDWSEL